MCAWCWGFAPVLAELRTRYPGAVELVLGGLAPDSSDPMPAEMRAYIQSAWEQVERASGATFNHAFWERCEPRRSTWPACRAVIAVERLAPGAGWTMFSAIQRAYYVEARNPSLSATLLELFDECGLDVARTDFERPPRRRCSAGRAPRSCPLARGPRVPESLGASRRPHVGPHPGLRAAYVRTRGPRADRISRIPR